MMDAHTVSDQSQVFAFLSDPATHGENMPVKRIDTHGAVIFLADKDAYKVKRAVRYSFMDFSTLEKRKLACEREFSVNCENAPAIYLGVVPVTRNRDGLRLWGDGEVVEWTVHMRRFDEGATLDQLAEREGPSKELVANIAHAVAQSHARAPRRDYDGASALDHYILDNAESFAESPELFAPERVAKLTLASRALLDENRPLLEARRKSGYIRRCHGDLHLRNIALIADKPVLFDALEFDEAMATGDVLYDLAFLVMDLWERSFAQAANAVLNHYLWECGEEEHLAGLAAFPLFLSVRAAIRAKVVAFTLPHLSESSRAAAAREAQRYFALAEQYLVAVPPTLIAIGGLSGTGKTTIAAELAPLAGRIPGAVHLRSDIERKHMFAVPETTHLPQSGYDSATTREVYARMQRNARLALEAGFTTIVDAVHALPEERHGTEAAAREAKVPFRSIWLDAPLELRIDRVKGRRKDASDADAEVLRKQLAFDVGEIDWWRVDASGTPPYILADICAALGLPEPSEHRP
jgi:aminoglycoside phosphotransferase family enzyme/predicted kinase